MWTTFQVTRLREMWAAGDAGSKIAAEIGRTRSAVHGKVHRLQLAPRQCDRRARVVSRAEVKRIRREREFLERLASAHAFPF